MVDTCEGWATSVCTIQKHQLAYHLYLIGITSANSKCVIEANQVSLLPTGSREGASGRGSDVSQLSTKASYCVYEVEYLETPTPLFNLIPLPISCTDVCITFCPMF